jgi:hypothetical protein
VPMPKRPKGRGVERHERSPDSAACRQRRAALLCVHVATQKLIPGRSAWLVFARGFVDAA